MFYEHIKVALTSIKAARFRSFLTMLGIIIGVVSVITTASLGEGVKKQISGQSRNVGQDLITIRPGKLVNRDKNNQITSVNLLSFLSSSSITTKDLESVQKDSNINKAVPFSVISGVPTIGKDQFNEGFIMATNRDMPSVISQKVEFGNFFDEDDDDRNVAVIGQQVAEKLFKENVPVSKTMQLRGKDFVVVGVLEKASANPLNPGADYNNGVFIPESAAKKLIGDDLEIYEIFARPKDKSREQVDITMGAISSNLKQNRGGQEDFTVLRQQDMLSVADNVLDLVNKSVTLMAAIALLVGGVGIMNVMFVSVTERTREIGIRKTVGATNRQIQTQFLVEAAVISGWGALIGIFISGVINLLFRVLTDLQPIITWQTVVVSTIASLAVGMIFGVIPAVKAARKDPIEALRSQ